MSEEGSSRFAAVVLAAGRGTRFGSPLPKVLQPLAGRPLLGHVLAALTAAGAHPTLLVLGYGADHVRAAFPRYPFVLQPEQRGTGDALWHARTALDPEADLVVVNGDLPLIAPATIQALHQARVVAGAAMAALTCCEGDPTGMGRVLRDAAGKPIAVVEERLATPEQRAVREWNCGLYAFAGRWLWPRLAALTPSPTGEVFLTDLVAQAAREGTLVTLTTDDPLAAAGVNTRQELVRSEAVLRERLRQRLLAGGVLLVSPETIIIDCEVEVGSESVVLPGCVLLGRTRIGARCQIGPHAIIEASDVGDDSVIEAAHLVGVRLPPRSHVASFTRLRARD
jgi:bifunctional UDP-N-acetylglucosamine pyrophosphorylase/glucosamine-1-phosphate N-acetyltransferase